MAHIFVLYKLKPGVTRQQHEKWSREIDIPALRSLKRVKSFHVHRVEQRILAEGAPSVDFVEVIDVPDFDGFVSEDLPGNVMQDILGQFSRFAENPEILLASQF